MTHLLKQEITSDVLRVYELEDVLKKKSQESSLLFFLPPTENPQEVSQLQLIHKQNWPSQQWML